MGWLYVAYGRDFEPMAANIFWIWPEFGISGYVHVLAQCGVILGPILLYMNWTYLKMEVTYQQAHQPKKNSSELQWWLSFIAVSFKFCWNLSLPANKQLTYLIWAEVGPARPQLFLIIIKIYCPWIWNCNVFLFSKTNNIFIYIRIIYIYLLSLQNFPHRHFSSCHIVSIHFLQALLVKQGLTWKRIWRDGRNVCGIMHAQCAEKTTF